MNFLPIQRVSKFRDNSRVITPNHYAFLRDGHAHMRMQIGEARKSFVEVGPEHRRDDKGHETLPGGQTGNASIDRLPRIPHINVEVDPQFFDTACPIVEKCR